MSIDQSINTYYNTIYMYIVYNLLFTITINIENYYYKTINTRWLYQIISLIRIIRLHKFTQLQYLSFGKSLVYVI